MPICDFCKQSCGVVVENNSFDHEFGTEHIFSKVSSCCGADVIGEDGDYFDSEYQDDYFDDYDYVDMEDGDR